MRPIDPKSRTIIVHRNNSALRRLLDARTWRRHPRPFAKTVHGKRRRDERRFIERNTCGFGCD